MNPKLLFLLVINLAFLALNFARFADSNEAPAVTVINQVTQIEPSNDSDAPEESAVSEPPQPEKPKVDKKLLLLEAKLAQAEQQNKLLAAQINRLNSEVDEQNSYISALQKDNVELELELVRAAQPVEVVSEVDLIKDSIQSQPDLLPRKPPKIPADKIEATAADDELAGDFSGSVEFGFSYAQDNQVTRAVNGRLILDYELADSYTLNSNLKFEMEDEDNEKSAEKYRWQLQADYYLDPLNLVFIRSDMQGSKFASYNREDIYTVGYGRIVFEEIKHKFNIEVGPGYRMAVPNVGTDAVSVDEFIIRTRLNYERIVSESLQLKMDAVFEIGRENSIYAATFKAQNRIYRELYLIFSTEYKYTENVPVDNLNKEVSSGLNLMYAF